MSIKNIYSKTLVALSSTFLLILYFFMFFTYKNSVISSAILRSSTVAQTIGSLSTTPSSVTELFDKLSIETINTFGINSFTKHLILIDSNSQTTYIFNGSLNNWVLEKEFACSLPNIGVPKGIFTSKIRKNLFLSQYFNKESQYCIHINDCYYLHLDPFYYDENIVANENLGEYILNGCIHLSVEDSKWIYAIVQEGSTLVIY